MIILEMVINMNEERLGTIDLDLSPQARAGWIRFQDEVERELGARGTFRGVRDVAAKAAENVARLAALFHVLEHGASGTITSEEIRAAASIVGWHLNEARRLLAERGRAWLEESGRRRSVVINPALLTELE